MTDVSLQRVIANLETAIDRMVRINSTTYQDATVEILRESLKLLKQSAQTEGRDSERLQYLIDSEKFVFEVNLRYCVRNDQQGSGEWIFYPTAREAIDQAIAKGDL